MRDFLLSVGANPFYLAFAWFLAAFPIVIAALAINSSRVFYLNRLSRETEIQNPHLEQLRHAQRVWPLASIVIPARDEQTYIEDTVDHALGLAWPAIEVIVINDGSTDGTDQVLQRFADHPKVTIIEHQAPVGKSRSLNEGIAAASSELVMILDADAVPDINVLARMASHFMVDQDVAAVTGNPRAIGIPNLLSKMQAIEFSSTISTLRRGQCAWGRINTVSGIMTLFRRSVVLNSGAFSSNQPTEDIEITWRLHRMGYRCIYEPAASVGMHVPQDFTQWFAQRKRWSRGLVRVLQEHGWGIVRRNEWPMYPVMFEALLAIIWCHVLVFMTALWAVALAVGAGLLGNSIVIGRWGAMTIGIALVQILWGMHLDANHDKGIRKLWPLAPWYPLVYWWMQAFTVVWVTVPTLLTKQKTVSWDMVRSTRGTRASRAFPAKSDSTD